MTTEKSSVPASVGSLQKIARAANTADRALQRVQARVKALNRMQVRVKMKMDDKATTSARKLFDRLNSAAKKGLRVKIKIEDDTEKPKTPLDRLKSMAKVWKVAFKLVDLISQPLKVIQSSVKKVFELTASEEQVKLKLGFFLKDKGLVESVFSKAKEFASTSPFDPKEVLSGVTSLTAGRFAPKDVFSGLLRDVGDLTAANKDLGVSFNDVAGIFAQLKAGDFSAFDRLRELNISRSDLSLQGLKFDENGEFRGSAEKAISAVRAAIRKNFGGAMEAQTKTWAGLWQRMQGSAYYVLTAIGNAQVSNGTTVLDLFKERLAQVTRLIIDESGRLTPLAEKFKNLFAQALDWVNSKIAAAMSYIEKRFLNNPDFQALTFGGKISFILDDLGAKFGRWFDEKGAGMLAEIGTKLGVILIKSLGNAVLQAMSESPLLAAIIGAALGSVFGPEGALLGAAAGLAFTGGAMIGKAIFGDPNEPQRAYVPPQELGKIFNPQGPGPNRDSIMFQGTNNPVRLFDTSGNPYSSQTGAPPFGSFAAAGVNVSASVNVNMTADEKALALQIGNDIVAQIKRAVENRC